MIVNKTMTSKIYDIIIIGAGIGGLLSATLLAKKGRDVLLIESHDRPGGLMQGFERRGVFFDSTSAFLMDCAENGNFTKLLNSISVKDISFIDVTDKFVGSYPDIEIKNSYMLIDDEFVKNNFPQELSRFEKYLRLMQSISRQLALLSKPKFYHYLLFPFIFSKVIRYEKKTVKEVLDKFFSDEKLKTILFEHPTTSPPSSAPFLFLPILYNSAMSGFFYPEKGFADLANKILNAFLQHRGEVLFNTKVTSIKVENGIQTIKTNDGKSFQASIVLSNISPLKTIGMIENLKDYEEKKSVRKFVERIKRATYSESAFLIYVKLKDSYDTKIRPFITGISSTYDMEKFYGTIQNGKMPEDFSIYILNPSCVAKDSPKTLTIGTVASYEYFKSIHSREGKETYLSLKKNYAERIIDFVSKSKYFPDLKDNIEFVETASPLTIERYTQNERGCSYGLKSTPKQFGRFKLPNKSPIKNLFFVGHYVYPAYGITGVAQSAEMAVAEIEKKIK